MKKRDSSAKVFILLDMRADGDATGKFGVFSGTSRVPPSWFAGNEATPDMDDPLYGRLIELEDGSAIWELDCYWMKLSKREAENADYIEKLKKRAEKIKSIMDNLDNASESEFELVSQIMDDGEIDLDDERWG